MRMWRGSVGWNAVYWMRTRDSKSSGTTFWRKRGIVRGWFWLIAGDA